MSTVKVGGAKGARIVKIIEQHPEMTRTQVAAAADATVGRVGEVVRWLAVNGTPAQQVLSRT